MKAWQTLTLAAGCAALLVACANKATTAPGLRGTAYEGIVGQGWPVHKVDLKGAPEDHKPDCDSNCTGSFDIVETSFIVRLLTGKTHRLKMHPSFGDTYRQWRFALAPEGDKLCATRQMHRTGCQHDVCITERNGHPYISVGHVDACGSELTATHRGAIH